MKKKYLVVLPITGTVSVEVEAASSKEAIEEALTGDHDLPDPEEWEVHRHVTRGNVFSGRLNDAYAEEMKK